MFHGRLGRLELNRLYHQAGVLVCTSSLEGFPNTFLEAWSVGLPVLTTFDPDRIIATHHLGAVAADLAGLEGQLRGLFASDDVYTARRARCYAYFCAHHTVDAVVEAHESMWRVDSCRNQETSCESRTHQPLATGL